ncbi:MAG: hypothetical protein A2428_05250 [Bdellovibrionales bacterium RIFOXYC1_FULL_54_43]|nr:MAG: hypothetical protein A2428_05250 [Bdellovibrionales bacterium RIFOXYC1_FULL_54_43]OFZ84938.1 MAG: hypothetical protein A2603_05210 [Bdellovibrionales bacterium RIFOXYD1_FULL_55_31]
MSPRISRQYQLRTICCAIALGTLFALNSCSSARTRVELRSDPPNAEILNSGGEVIGATPLVLSGDQLQKITVDGRAFATLNAPGHIATHVIFDIHGEDIHEVKLAKLDSVYFSRSLLRDFQAQANEMSKTLLQIQGLVALKKLDEAEKAIQEFQKTYPNIAASYAFQGSIELMRGNSGKARGYLLRAQSLDPHDPVAARLLGNRAVASSPAVTPKQAIPAIDPTESNPENPGAPGTSAPIPVPSTAPDTAGPGTPSGTQPGGGT